MAKKTTETLEVRKIFIGSPGDLGEERKAFRKVVERVNKIKARSMCIHLEPVGWEDTLPGKGRPQGLINKDVVSADLVLLLLWKRWGTPTGEYSSGFEEEYEVARENNIQIWFHFKNIPNDMLADPGKQLRKVIDFRDRIERERQYLYKPYRNAKTWKKMLEEDLCRWLDDLDPVLQTGANVRDLQRQNEELMKALEKSKATIDTAAVDMVIEARELADNGQITRAWEIFARVEAMSGSLYSINNYGMFLERIGLLDEAEEKLKAVVSAAEVAEDKVWTAIGYGNLGNVYLTRGDLDKAEKMYLKSQEINKELGRKEENASLYGNLGSVYLTRGDLGKAEKMYLKSLEIDKELGRKEGIANQYGNLGNVHQIRGDVDKAEEMYLKSLEINKELGRKEGMAKDYGNLGIVYQTRGDLDKAEEMHLKSLKIEKELGRKEGIASDYGNLGIVYLTCGDLGKAEKMYLKSLEINKELGRREGIASQHGNLGNVYLTRGDLDKAEEMYLKSLEINKELGLKEGMAKNYLNLGLISANRRDIDEATQYWKKAQRLYKQIGITREVQKVTALLDKALEQSTGAK